MFFFFWVWRYVMPISDAPFTLACGRLHPTSLRQSFFIQRYNSLFSKCFFATQAKDLSWSKSLWSKPKLSIKNLKKKKSNVCKVSLSDYRSNFNVGQHSQSRFGILLIRSKKKRSCFPLVLVSNVFPNVPTHSPFCLLVFWRVRDYTCPFFNYYSGTLFKYS